MKLEIELEEEIKAWHYADGKIAVRFDGATEIFDLPGDAEEAIELYLGDNNSLVIAAAAADIIITGAKALDDAAPVRKEATL